MIITTNDLEALNPCPEQVDLFNKTFPPGNMAVTRDNLLRAYDVGLDVAWGVEFLPQFAHVRDGFVQRINDLLCGTYNPKIEKAWETIYAKYPDATDMMEEEVHLIRTDPTRSEDQASRDVRAAHQRYNDIIAPDREQIIRPIEREFEVEVADLIMATISSEGRDAASGTSDKA